MTWKAWKERFPEGTVLSSDTGHRRDYRSNPYVEYLRGNRLMFPVRRLDDRLAERVQVLGVWNGGGSIAIHAGNFTADRLEREVSLGESRFVVQFDPVTKIMRVKQADAELQWAYSFWFAWSAFRPDTQLLPSDQ